MPSKERHARDHIPAVRMTKGHRRGEREVRKGVIYVDERIEGCYGQVHEKWGTCRCGGDSAEESGTDELGRSRDAKSTSFSTGMARAIADWAHPYCVTTNRTSTPYCVTTNRPSIDVRRTKVETKVNRMKLGPMDSCAGVSIICANECHVESTTHQTLRESGNVPGKPQIYQSALPCVSRLRATGRR